MAIAPKMTECKVRNGSVWVTMSINDAVAAQERDGRCLECEMPVRAHRQSVNGMAAHFEHLARNPTCSRSGKRSRSRPHEAPASAQTHNAVGQTQIEASTLTRGQLAELKGKVEDILNSLEGGKRIYGEKIRRRIGRLSQEGGPLPRKIAALMVSITEFRNSAEHDSQNPTATESNVLRSALQAINEWLARKTEQPQA